MIRSNRAWKAACVVMWLVITVGLCFGLLPWRPAPEMKVEIWFPPDYDQFSKEAQGKMAVRWMSEEPKKGVNLEVFQEMDFQTTSVVFPPSSRPTRTFMVKYVGETDEHSPLVYAYREVDIPFAYSFAEKPTLQANILSIKTKPDWVASLAFTGGTSFVAVWLIFMVYAFVMRFLEPKRKKHLQPVNNSCP